MRRGCWNRGWAKGGWWSTNPTRAFPAVSASLMFVKGKEEETEEVDGWGCFRPPPLLLM